MKPGEYAMPQEDGSIAPGRQRFVKWAAVLFLAAGLAWLGAYLLGAQIYEAILDVTH
jgi:hypothetical protein